MKQPLIVHFGIQQILNREVHCASSVLSAVRQVIEHAYPKAVNPYAEFAKQDRTHRRYFVASAIFGHLCNKSQYHSVMSGRSRGPVPVRYLFDTGTKQISIK